MHDRPPRPEEYRLLAKWSPCFVRPRLRKSVLVSLLWKYPVALGAMAKRPHHGASHRQGDLACPALDAFEQCRHATSGLS